ncbi:hypothetical protein ElyMa_003151200 [Elysia marginata]|uniref:DH domain-containing protein n=1 Tax=Elysia marginata TaxID=1093978 RepID=A0AAV4IW25_9GAST|nr:hypothetical protein ElyMa_003151200 [Elysia marginata]
MLQVKRIPDYARYLNDLLGETDPAHPDYEDLSKAAGRVTSMVKERENALSETDPYSAMDAVQGRFPKDDLRLHQGHTEIGSPVTTTSTNINNNNTNSTNDDDNNNNSTNSNSNGSHSTTETDRDTPNASPTAIKGDHMLRNKNGSDLASDSPTATPITTSPTTTTNSALSPDVVRRKDHKSNNGSSSSVENGGKASPSGMHRHSKNINNNNEDKDAHMLLHLQPVDSSPLIPSGRSGSPHQTRAARKMQEGQFCHGSLVVGPGHPTPPSVPKTRWKAAVDTVRRSSLSSVLMTNRVDT